MEHSLLRSFLAVAETLHFSRAADALHLSQPALSAQIRRLETELGVQLFERSRQTTTLTFAGTIYQAEATEILAMSRQAVEHARLAAAGKLGRLRVGFISTAAAYLIPPLVAMFRADHPAVDLDLQHHLTAEQVALLKSDMIDIAFLRIPLLEEFSLTVVPIHSEPFKLFLPTEHPLASEPELELRHLDGAAFVTYSRRNAPGFAALLSTILQDAKVRPSSTHEANDMYTLISLVSAGVGIAIAPASLMNYRLPNIAVRDMGNVYKSEIGLVHRHDLEHPAAMAFVRLAKTISSGRAWLPPKMP